MFFCSICGVADNFLIEQDKAPRDNFRCSNCRSMVRQRDVAQLIVDSFGRGGVTHLSQLLTRSRFRELDIYEIGMTGPLHKILAEHPKYVNSYYWEDIERGSIRNGVRSEDVTKLTFLDSSFDLIVSLEVLEHVFDIELALREISRVLKPCGLHIFSVPVRYPLPAKTLHRAKVANGQIVNLEPPRYHIAGDGSKSLVVSDFGEDFIDLHEQAGLKLDIIYRSAPHFPANRNASFVARKI